VLHNINISMKNLSFEIPSTRDNVRYVEKYIENAKVEYNINEDVYGNIIVAVTESVSNAIIHGNKLDESKKVSLDLSFSEKEITIEIEDQGSGYDYNNVPDPTLPENINKIGGRGVFLIKNLSDKVAFFNDGRKVQMIFNV